MTIDRSRMMKRGTLIGQQLARSDFWHERIFNTLRQYVTWWGGGRRFFDRMHVSRSRGLANVAERRWTSRRTNARMHARGGDQASRRRVHVVSVVTSAGSCVHAPHATRARQLPPLECRITHAARTMLDHSRMRRKNDEFDPLTTRFREPKLFGFPLARLRRGRWALSRLLHPLGIVFSFLYYCARRERSNETALYKAKHKPFFFFFPQRRAGYSRHSHMYCIFKRVSCYVLSIGIFALSPCFIRQIQRGTRENRKSNIISLISCFIYSDSSRRAYAMYINVQIEFVIAWDPSEALKNINIIAKKKPLYERCCIAKISITVDLFIIKQENINCIVFICEWLREKLLKYLIETFLKLPSQIRSLLYS